MEIYDKNPILKLKQELLKEIGENSINEEITFEEVLKQYSKFNSVI